MTAAILIFRGGLSFRVESGRIMSLEMEVIEFRVYESKEETIADSVAMIAKKPTIGNEFLKKIGIACSGSLNAIPCLPI